MPLLAKGAAQEARVRAMAEFEGSLLQAGHPRRIVLAVAILAMVVTGILGVWGSREVVERSTVTTVLPGTVLVTVTVYEHSLVIESPRVLILGESERESQVCTVVFRKIPTTLTVSVVTLGWMSVIPGGTTTHTLSTLFESTATTTLSAYTTTYWSIYWATTVTTVGDHVMTLPVWHFGKMEEVCRAALMLVKARLVPERLPATVVIRLERVTFVVTPISTITLPPLPPDSGSEFTTTYVTTKPRTTVTHLHLTIEPTTVTIQAATRVTQTVTITRPGSTVTTVILVTRTIEEGTTPTAATTPRTAVTTPMTTITQPLTTTPTVPARPAGRPPPRQQTS